MLSQIMDIVVEQSKSVTVKGLHQWSTYQGLLEGFPTTKMNTRILAHAVEKAKGLFGSEAVYLIKPEQTPISYDGVYPFGEPATLPAVGCITDLWYHRAIRSSSMDYSALTVIWFQEEFAFPLETRISQKFIALPWSELAGEYDY